MAKGLLGLEISDKILRYVYLEKEQSDYCVIKADKIEIKINPSAPGSLYKIVQSILEQKDIQPRRIFVTISRRDTAIHQTLLPKMSSSELDEVVSGEIEKIPVFYHRNFDYIYKSYPYSNEKNRIIFAATSRKILNFIIQEIQKTNIRFQDLDISPLNLKEILPLPKSSKHLEAFFVIQDHQSYLGIFEDHQYKLLYKSALGLDHISTAASQLGKEHILSSLMAEMKRAIKSYLSENKKAELNFLWLLWDKEVVFDLDQRIAHDLGLEVEVLYMKKMQKIKVTKEKHLNPVYVIPLLPIIYHIRRLKAQFSFTHFFRSIQIKNYLLKTVVMSLSFIVILGSALGLLYSDLQQKITQGKREKQQISQELKSLDAKSKDLFQKEKEYLAIRQKLLNQATYVAHLNRVSWAQVFSVFSEELPEKMALMSFKFSSSGKAQIKGQAFEMESIAELIRRIDESSILEKGKFDFLRENQIQDQKFFDFGILAHLKKESEKNHD